jgi:thiol-disulfide isomerase/thioredoxin
MIATPEAVAGYNAQLQQKNTALKQEQLDQARLAQQAQAAALLQKQTQEQERAKPAANDYEGKPLTLKFTAVDGSPVDLASLKGKVVLVDFWATWCGPCMGEVPNVVATYKKYHDKGFEIIGISLDENKDAMLKVTAEKEMTWPQYFDGKGWKNEISSSFHIQAIPAMWLINKKGIIDTVQAREKLDAEVAKLLDE